MCIAFLKRAIFLSFVSCLCWASVGSAGAEIVARDIRIGVHKSKTRVVLDLTTNVKFTIFALADPYRIVLDLPDIRWQVPAAAARRNGGLIAGLRYGQYQPGKSRVVLDLRAPGTVGKSFMLPPGEGYGPRLVIDIKNVSRKAFLASIRPPAKKVPRATQKIVLKPTRKPAERPLVVIDPGHGGVDPGAIGISGIFEKRVTLAMARQVGKAIQALGRQRVRLTRNRDIFIPLRRRVAIARAAGAELFVSIHADSIANRRVRGGGIYTLSENSSDKEAAALAASRWMGRGDKEGADGAAVDAMRAVLNDVNMDGLVIIGEGEKDEAPMLFNGENVGNGSSPATDIAVDPIDGTTLTSLGRGNAVAVIAVSPRGTMFDPGPCVYMEKIAAGPDCVGVIDITKSPTENLHAVAAAKGESVNDITAVILDRDRHHDLISEVRTAGARIRLIPDGDVAGAISTAWADSGADVLFGIGGTPEGVITAAALKCMGGVMEGRLWPRNDKERNAALDLNYDLEKVLTIDDLVSGDNCFFAATGITDGDLIKGVHYSSGKVHTQTLVMRSLSGTVRLISASHNSEKLDAHTDGPA